MTQRYLATWVLVLFGIATSGVAVGQEEPTDPEHARQMAAGQDLFKREVRTLFAGRCLKCHGGEKTEGEFSLATREEFLKGGASGKAIELRKSSESLLMRLISHEDEPVMPEDGAKLDQRQIDAIGKWIDLGAPYDKPLRATDDVDPLAWTQRTIDAVGSRFLVIPTAASCQAARNSGRLLGANRDRSVHSCETQRCRNHSQPAGVPPHTHAASLF